MFGRRGAGFDNDDLGAAEHHGEAAVDDVVRPHVVGRREDSAGPLERDRRPAAERVRREHAPKAAKGEHATADGPLPTVMVAITALLFVVSSTNTDPRPGVSLTTYTRVPSGLTATAFAPALTIVSITVLKVPLVGSVSITDTVPLVLLATYTRVPSGLTATPIGLVPTVTVAMRPKPEVSITDTEPAP